MTDTTTYPLSLIVSVVLNTEATGANRLAGEIVDTLHANGYLVGEPQAAWDAVLDRIGPRYGRVTDRDLADAALEALTDRHFLLDAAS